jgi:hypothetical protein
MDRMDKNGLLNGQWTEWTMDRDYVTPLQGFADGGIPDPGRCPGLVYHALFRANPNIIGSADLASV